jgi:hypothetical protein
MAESENTQNRPAPLDLASLREYHGRPLGVGYDDMEPVAAVREVTVHQVWPAGALARSRGRSVVAAAAAALLKRNGARPPGTSNVPAPRPMCQPQREKG